MIADAARNGELSGFGAQRIAQESVGLNRPETRVVSFRDKAIRLVLKDGIADLGISEYLLFLKARENGRYEPVSGRVDPELSVPELHAPLPGVLSNDNAK